MFTNINCVNWGFEKKTQNLISCLLGVLMLAVVSVSASAQDSSLVANPGHSRVIEVGTTLTLDGSGSVSSPGLSITYAWSLIQ